MSGLYADAEAERSVVLNYLRNQQEIENDTPELEELLRERFRSTVVPVQLRTLSSIIAAEGLNRIDLLKINVEKSELDVLLGIRADDWAKIRQLVIEVDERKNLGSITTLLNQHGFQTTIEQDPVLKNTDLHYVYALRPDLKRPPGLDATIPAPVAGPDPEIITPAALINRLKQKLPAYMIPSHFVLMEKFPLTLNGKIDRRALQASDLAQVQSSKISMQANTDIERTIASIWCELLNLKSVSANDDFFELGGKSLMAMRVVARICQTFDVDLTIRNLFEHSTVAGLAKIVDQLSWMKTRGGGSSADREEIRL